ncbi:MAG: hypothetical protein ACI8S6_001327 [Myxococcota bacterium]|jgi:hypothetical protein
MLGFVLALAFALALTALGDLRSSAAEAVAILVMWGASVMVVRPRGGRPRDIFLAALVIRATLLLSAPTLSDDLYRYLWEGRAALMGGSPYLHPPAAAIWPADPIRVLVNHPEITSIYPPAAMWGFALLGALWYDPMVIKAAMGLLDALVAWALASVLVGRRRKLDGAWLYALHPLAVVESAGSGHLEPAALLCLVLAIRSWDRGGSGVIFAGLGGLIKLLPLTLLPVLWRRAPHHLLAVLLLAAITAAPFLDAELSLLRGLGTYTRHWSFNASLFTAFELIFGEWARPVAVGVGASVALLAITRRSDPAAAALWIGGAFVLLSPTVHPWYIAWAWVPALICGVQAWSVLATLAPLSYAVLVTWDPSTGSWDEPWWPVWVQYVPFVGVMAWEFGLHLTRPGPWAPGRTAESSPSPSPTPPGRSIPPPRSPPSGSESAR